MTPAACIPVLETPRLRLRAPERADFEPYARFFASARAVNERGRCRRARAWGHFGSAVAGWVLNGYGAFSITDRETGAYFGEAGVFREHDYPEPELGWMLMPEAEGRGIAREAALAVRGWADGRGLVRLVSYISPRNARSIRLAERLGAVLDPAAAKVDPDDLVYRHPAPEAP